MRQPLLQPQNPQTHILGGDQASLLKQGYLDAAAPDVHNGGSLFHDLVKIFRSGSNGFIIHKTLLGIAQHINPDPGALPDLIQQYLRIFRLPHGAGSVCLIITDLIGSHDILELFQDTAEFVHRLIGDLALRIGIAA